MTNWPVAGGTVRDTATERNLRDIRKRGGGVERRLDEYPRLPSPGARTLIAGQVSAAGAVVLGDGFTSEKTGVGKYTIAFKAPLATVPSVTYGSVGTFGHFTTAEATQAFFKVVTGNAAGAEGDHAFGFKALG